MMIGIRGVFPILLLAISWSLSPDMALSFTMAWVIGPSIDNQNPMVNRATSCKPPSIYVPATATWSCNSNSNKDIPGTSCLHCSVVSPRRADVGDGIDDDNVDHVNRQRENFVEEVQEKQERLSRIFRLLQAEPRDLLRFENEDSSGVRGIYLNRSIKSGEIVLKLPLDSCLIDVQSPSWLDDQVKKDPHRWATRLAACWIDLHLKGKQTDSDYTNTDNAQQVDIYNGHVVWSSLLPDPEYLKASLPVHWPETTLLNARSTALELAVDSAFFARAEAVHDLVRGIQRSPYVGLFSKQDDVEMHKRMNELAHDALDLVQTRSCRLEDEMRSDDPDCRRVLAPIFDFINHGSRHTDGANSYFVLEEEEQQKKSDFSSSSDTPSSCSKREYLVVRSMQDISQDEEIKIDYGACARPAWKCLLSYGFVPEYKRITCNAEDGENLAEVYMKGVRYEVADNSVPIDMVADATPRPWVDEDDDPHSNANLLTPDIALRIADRIAKAAYYLLLEPEQILDENESSLEEDSDAMPPTPFDVISKQLAASLRWSQHRILLTCAAGLAHFAKEHKKEESSYQ